MQTHELLRAYIENSSNPDMRIYGADFLRHADRLCWQLDHMMQLAGARNARVLDLGCGYGWDALYMAHAGQNEVVALDIRPLMIDAINEGIAALSAGSGPIAVRAITQDICAELTAPELEPGSFDVVFSLQAIEHIRDLEGCFRAVHRLLKPGGRFICANDSNARNRTVVEETEEMWTRRDRSLDYMKELASERPVENADAEPYAVMRERIVREAQPDLADADVTVLVAATAGMVADEITTLAQGFTPGAILPNPPAHSWCRNPLTGEYCERLLDPFELAKWIGAAGFTQCRVRHALRRFPLNWLNGVSLRAVNDLIFQSKPLFVLRAVRDDAPTRETTQGTRSTQNAEAPTGRL